MGRITASFRASLAPSRPATSFHLTLGFSIMMAPVRGRLCSHGHCAPDVCQEPGEQEPPSLPAPLLHQTPTYPAAPQHRAQFRGYWTPTLCLWASRSLSPPCSHPSTDATDSQHNRARRSPSPISCSCSFFFSGFSPSLSLSLLGRGDTRIRSGTGPGVAAGSCQLRRQAGRALASPRTPCCHSGTL